MKFDIWGDVAKDSKAKAQHQEKHMSSTWLATSHRQKLA
jgi:hypothetical protein